MRTPTRPFLFAAILAITTIALTRPALTDTPKPATTTAAATKPATTKVVATKPTSRPVVAKWAMRPLPAGEVNLIAMGDWGGSSKQQKAVAEALAGYAGGYRAQFAGLLSVGDNFYTKMQWGEDDYEWQSVFEDMYDARRINFPFYAALGNHDFEGTKMQAELAYARKYPQSRWKMPARYYRLDFPDADKPLVTVLVLDSNKPKLSADEWLKEMEWIDAQLADRRGAKWTLACAHHPLFSNGAHGDNGVLQTHWGPIFKKYKLDFYVCGHDHDLQHLQIPNWDITFMLTGGGGRGATKMRRDLRGPFSRSLNGFAHLRFMPDKVEVRYVNGADGKTVHAFERLPAARVNVSIKGGADKASTQPLKVLLGLDDEGNEKPDKDEKPD